MTIRSRQHRTWDNVANVATLPNVLASPTQDPALIVGDTCYVVGALTTYVCTLATLGAATWAPMNGTPSLVGFGNANVGNAASTRYLSPWYSDTQAPVIGGLAQMIAPRSGTLSRMYVKHTTLSANANNLVYTLRLNGVATALAVTLAGNGSSASNLVNTVPVNAGNALDVEVTKPGGAVNPSPGGITVSMVLS